MKLKNNFVLKQIAGETFAIYCQNDTADFRRAISLKGSAEVMFKALLEDTSREELATLLINNYDMSEKQADEDIELFLKLLSDNNLLDG